MSCATMLQVFFAPPKPDEGDGEIIDWVEEEEEAGYMTPPTEAQPAAAGLPWLLPVMMPSFSLLVCARHGRAATSSAAGGS